MTERENAMRAILRDGEPEWVPIASKCFKTVVPSAILERPKGQKDGVDWYGCEWVHDAPTNGFVQRFSEGPMLSDVREWEETVRFPDLGSVDWGACAKYDLSGFDRDEQALQIFWESGPFERTHHLLGFEGAFLAMCEEPDAYMALINAITDLRIDAMGRLIEAYDPDVIFTHDDLGHMRGPLMSLGMYREFIKPCHRRMEQFIRSKDVIVTHHSCGMVQPFIGDMIECGAHVINNLQGGINDQKAILEQYGGEASFHGGLSPLISYSSATEEELRAEVRRAIDLFAPYHNFIISTDSVYPRNTEILTDEAVKYGVKR